MRRQRWSRDQALHYIINEFAVVLPTDTLPELQQSIGIIIGAVSVLHRQTVPLNQVIEPVAPMLRIEAAGKLHGAKYICLEILPCPSKGILDKPIIKAGIVGDKNVSGKQVLNVLCQLCE